MATEIYQLDLDWDLISHLADTASVDALRAEQVSVDVIEDPLAQSVFCFQMEHLREHGQAATGTVLEAQFEQVHIDRPQTAIGDLIDRLRERYVRNEGRSTLKALYEQAYTEPHAVAKLMMREGRRLADLTAKRGSAYSQGDFDRWIQTYYKRKGRGLGPSLGFKELDGHFNGMAGVTFLIAAPKTYKALALDTPIPVPGGWTTMGALRVGDTVFDERGHTCNVIGKSPVWEGRPCYTVKFSDGTSIVADAEHLWVTRIHGTKGREAIRTTAQIAQTLRRSDGGANHSIRVAGPLACPDVQLPIDPYVLGVWLGDGTAADGAITSADDEVITHIRNAGYEVTKWPSAKYVYGILGLRQELREARLLGNKHVPQSYLRASYEQRLALLQGLMDSDGSCSQRGDSTFVTTSVYLRDAILELTRSLGLKPSALEYRASIDGRDCGPKWHVRFCAYSDRPVFRLTRKANNLRGRPNRLNRSQTRQIIAVDPVESVPVQCITVDSVKSLYLAGEGMIATHNSWLTTNATIENVLRGKFPYLYSLELPDEETKGRLLCMAADLPYWKYLKGTLNREEELMLKEVDQLLAEKGRYTVEKPNAGERSVQRMVERAINAGADCIFIDQLQYIEAQNGHSLGALNNTGDYFQVVNDLRNYSDDIPIFVVHQFNRSVMNAKGMPEVQQGKGSSAIEEVATLALGIWASKEMRQDNQIEIGTLASRNYAYASWRLQVSLTKGCDMKMIGMVEDEEL